MSFWQSSSSWSNFIHVSFSTLHISVIFAAHLLMTASNSLFSLSSVSRSVLYVCCPFPAEEKSINHRLHLTAVGNLHLILKLGAAYAICVSRYRRTNQSVPGRIYWHANVGSMSVYFARTGWIVNLLYIADQQHHSKDAKVITCLTESLSILLAFMSLPKNYAVVLSKIRHGGEDKTVTGRKMMFVLHNKVVLMHKHRHKFVFTLYM